MDLNKLHRSIAEPSQQSHWNPPFCGDIDMQIKQDGTWWYMGTPIGRAPLVKLFASVLRRENDRYFLVTPVEKVGIQVEDVPFVVVEWEWQGPILRLKTLQEEWISVDQHHPVELRTDSNNVSVPYVLIREGLWARLHRNIYYQLIEQAESKVVELANGSRQDMLYLNSGEYDFALGCITD